MSYITRKSLHTGSSQPEAMLAATKFMTRTQSSSVDGSRPSSMVCLAAAMNSLGLRRVIPPPSGTYRRYQGTLVPVCRSCYPSDHPRERPTATYGRWGPPPHSRVVLLGHPVQELLRALGALAPLA